MSGRYSTLGTAFFRANHTLGTGGRMPIPHSERHEPHTGNGIRLTRTPHSERDLCPDFHTRNGTPRRERHTRNGMGESATNTVFSWHFPHWERHPARANPTLGTGRPTEERDHRFASRLGPRRALSAPYLGGNEARKGGSRRPCAACDGRRPAFGRRGSSAPTPFREGRGRRRARAVAGSPCSLPRSFRARRAGSSAARPSRTPLRAPPPAR